MNKVRGQKILELVEKLLVWMGLVRIKLLIATNLKIVRLVVVLI